MRCHRAKAGICVPHVCPCSCEQRQVNPVMSGDSLHGRTPSPLVRGHTWEQMGLVPPPHLPACSQPADRRSGPGWKGEARLNLPGGRALIKHLLYTGPCSEPFILVSTFNSPTVLQGGKC